MHNFYFNKNLKNPFFFFLFRWNFCIKCYAFVFKSKLLSQSHIPYYITVVITNLKKKNPAR